MDPVEIYLSMDVCEQLGLSYYRKDVEDGLGTHTGEARLDVGSLLHYRKMWDIRHRKLFSEYVILGERIHVCPAVGPGWFQVLNYPVKIDRPSISLIDVLDNEGNPKDVTLIKD